MPAGAPILFPSGEDANPLHKRLPAEVVTRKPRQSRAVEEKIVDEVKVDLKTAVTLKPDARPKWLSKACKMAEENKAPTTELYNIVTSRKFVSGLPPRIGKKLRDIVHENLDLFSDRQQRYLKSEEWVLNGRYADRADDGEPLDGGKDGGVPDGAGSDGAGGSIEREATPRARRPQASDEPQAEKWVTVAGGRGQEERTSREQTLAEERAKRKAQEREEQERWMQAEVEASRRRAQEQQEAKKRQLENQVDDSMMLLEQLAGGTAALPPVQRQHSERSSGGRRHGLSRSRSVRVRSRSRRRRRRRSESAPRPKVDFADALRRRMEEREANDTTRIPVVDPGHAARWAARDPNR